MQYRVKLHILFVVFLAVVLNYVEHLSLTSENGGYGQLLRVVARDRGGAACPRGFRAQ